MIIFYKKIIKFVLNHFTLVKLLGAIFTALLVASLKYYISGDLHIEYCNFWGNLCVALLGWITNTSIIGWLTEYLGIKGLNFNLNQFIYGFHTIKMGNEYPLGEFKPKLYNAMNIDSGNYSNSSNDLDKGKGVDRELDRNSDENLGFPKKTNPGPGFNVLGGEVPYNDSIVQYLDYNTHYLIHFKNLDLETAIEQRNNNLLLIRITEGKLNYARNALSKIPSIPTTEYEFRLRNQIISDLDTFNRNKIKAEARTTLLTSRIEFIEGKINKK